MKTALFALPRGWDRRFVLTTGIVDVMREAGVRAVILTPKADDPEFRARFPNLDLEYYRAYEPKRLEATYRRALRVLFAGRFPGHSLDCLTREFVYAWNHDRPVKMAYYRGLRASARAFPWIYDAAARLDALMPLEAEWKKLFDKWKPDALITMPIFDYTDLPLLKWARKLGVPSASIVTAWDNISTKGPMPVQPDALIVWNRDMAREAIETHDFPADRVGVTGVPVFDHWVDPPRTPRDAFMKKYGLDPGKKLLGYLTGGPGTLPREWEIVEHILEANAQGAFGERLPLFVRLHPRDNRTEWDRFMGQPGVVIERPMNTVRADWDANRDDLAHLADTLRAMDVEANMFSTVTIESCVARRPVFIVAYDGNQVLPYERSALRYLEFTHYKSVTGCGIPVAKSKEEMIGLYRDYLQNSEKDREARERVVDLLAGTVGGAAVRTARALASFVLHGPTAITRF